MSGNPYVDGMIIGGGAVLVVVALLAFIQWLGRR